MPCGTNANDLSRDKFSSVQKNQETATRFGVFLSTIVVPILLLLYSALWFTQFYVGLGPDSPPLNKVITTEQLQYGQKIFPLALTCNHRDGCYFRLTGADACASGTVAGGAGPNNGFCSDPTLLPVASGGASTPASCGVGSQCNTAAAANACGTANGPCCRKATCDTELSSAQGVCAFSPPGADPTDALTVAWAYKSGCSGACNFGVTLVTDYIDSNGDVAQKEVKVHRGIALMNLIEHDDPKMSWSKSHPNYAANKKKTTMYEWSITMVDVEGTVDAVSNLCMNQMRADSLVTTSGGSETVYARRVKLVPAATYTKMSTAYPSPGLAYLSAIGGISSTIMAVLAYVHAFHLKFLNRAASSAPQAAP